MKFDALESALVTGGSSGIGLAVAQRLAARGVRVFLVARNAGPLQQVADQLASHDVPCGHFAADVSDRAQAQAAIAAATEVIGPIQLLVNSAGIVIPGYALHSTSDDFGRQMSVNYMGTVHMTAAVLPGMVERRAGWIANVASVAGLKGLFGYAGYCASKFAVVGYSEALRAEMREHGVSVSVLCPPDTRTPMLARETPLRPIETKTLAEMGNVLEPAAVADALLAGLQRGTFRIVPGVDAKLMHAADRMLPGLVDRVMERVVRKAQKRS